MPIRLDARSPDFPTKFRAFLDAKREASADVEQAVRAIIADVAARGDAALAELTQKFDRVDLNAMGMRVTPAELNAAEPTIPIAAERGEAYLSAASGNADEYSVTATATNGDELTISENPGGEVSRQCASPVEKTGCSGGESSSW